MRAAPRDASLWHRRGVIAWQMARDRRTDGRVRGAKDIALIADADSSLRLAAAFAPDSAQFSIDLGRFYLNSNLVTLRTQALSQFNRALEAARRTGDRFGLAEAADQAGMAYWRRYEAVANRRNLRGVDVPDFDRYVKDYSKEPHVVVSIGWESLIPFGVEHVARFKGCVPTYRKSESICPLLSYSHDERYES